MLVIALLSSVIYSFVNNNIHVHLSGSKPPVHNPASKRAAMNIYDVHCSYSVKSDQYFVEYYIQTGHSLPPATQAVNENSVSGSEVSCLYNCEELEKDIKTNDIQLIENKGIVLYPNPTAGEVRMVFENSNNFVLLYNSLGQIVLEQSIYGYDGYIDITNFMNGIYTLEVISGGSRLVKKIVKY